MPTIVGLNKQGKNQRARKKVGLLQTFLFCLIQGQPKRNYNSTYGNACGI